MAEDDFSNVVGGPEEIGVSEFRMARGREFQRVGAAMAKALSPRVRYLVLVMEVRRLVSAERRRRVGEWQWRRCYVRGCKVV